MFRFKKPKIKDSLSEVTYNEFFIDILEKGNLSVLCYYGKATRSELDDAWVKVSSEFEMLSGGKKFNLEINRENSLLQKRHRIQMLSTLLTIKQINPETDVSEIESYLKVKGYSIEKLTNRILQEQTRLSIDAIEARKLKTKENNTEPLSHFEGKGLIERGLGLGYLDGDKLRMTEWISYCQQYDRYVENLEKNSKNGK